VEKSLQREGKTAVNLDTLAHKLGFAKVDDLFIAVGKDKFSLRHVEAALHEPVSRAGAGRRGGGQQEPRLERGAGRQVGRAGGRHRGPDDPAGALLQAGAAGPDRRLRHARQGRVDPPRQLQELRRDGRQGARARDRDRLGPGRFKDTVYPIDIFILAADRQGLLRDISEVLTREKINVIGVNTQSSKGQARMVFTAEIGSTGQLQKAITAIGEVQGVQEAKRT
jgi:GTP pyrophosphokinase